VGYPYLYVVLDELYLMDVLHTVDVHDLHMDILYAMDVHDQHIWLV